ncbi:PAP2 superfamily protein [uncultured archaeon]|nr:PAP2 superfamily protein [uncultured archaeon]
MTDLNLALFYIINGPAGKSPVLDTAAIFTANYLLYIFLIYLAYLWFARSKYRQEILFAGYAAILGLGLNFIITLFYFHPRPFMIPVGTLLIAHAPETSFPSDHTTFMFAVSLMFLTFKDFRSKGAVLFVLAFIGGLARVYAGLHFPMDIAGSLVVALISVGLLSFLKQYLVHVNQVLIVYFGIIEDRCTKGN